MFKRTKTSSLAVRTDAGTRDWALVADYYLTLHTDFHTVRIVGTAGFSEED